MKYKVYAFATEDERLAALNDVRNEGLQYATEMKGESGCDGTQDHDKEGQIRRHDRRKNVQAKQPYREIQR